MAGAGNGRDDRPALRESCDQPIAVGAADYLVVFRDYHQGRRCNPAHSRSGVESVGDQERDREIGEKTCGHCREAVKRSDKDHPVHRPVYRNEAADAGAEAIPHKRSKLAKQLADLEAYITSLKGLIRLLEAQAVDLLGKLRKFEQ